MIKIWNIETGEYRYISSMDDFPKGVLGSQWLVISEDLNPIYIDPSEIVGIDPLPTIYRITSEAPFFNNWIFLVIAILIYLMLYRGK